MHHTMNIQHTISIVFFIWKTCYFSKHDLARLERELAGCKEEVSRMSREKASMSDGMEKGQREVMESKEWRKFQNLI